MQPEDNGSTAVAAAEGSSSNPPLLQLDDILIRACWKNESFLTTHGQIERIISRGNVADLANPLSNKVLVGKRIKPDGTVAPIRDGGDLFVLDGMAARAAMAGMAATGPNLQQDMLVQLLAAQMAPNSGNHNRNRLGALLGRASSGDDDPAPFGRRALQFFGGLANDFLEDFALEMDKLVRAAPVDPAIGISDAVCSPVMVMECINAMLVSAARHGSAVLLHRRGDGENTFESFCRDAAPVSADLEPSQLLRVISSPSLDLLLKIMVRADLATFHDNGKIVAIGGQVDEEKDLGSFRLKHTISTTKCRIDMLQGDWEAQTAQARKAKQEGKRDEALHCLKLRKSCERDLALAHGVLYNSTKQLTQMEGLKYSMEVFETYNMAKSAMQAYNREVTIDKVDELMDDLTEENELADNVNVAIQNVTGMELDDGEEADLLAELEELQQSDKLEKLKKLKVDGDENMDVDTSGIASVSIDDTERMTDGDAKADGAAEQVVEEKPAVVKEAQQGKQKKMVAA